MPFTHDLDPAIIKEISEEYRRAACWLPFSAIAINEVFDKDELIKLSSFISDMKKAGLDNEKKAKAIETYSEVVLKLLSMAKIIVT
jgi:hypothetical protein